MGCCELKSGFQLQAKGIFRRFSKKAKNSCNILLGVQNAMEIFSHKISQIFLVFKHPNKLLRGKINCYEL
jgi:hypothetical protein